MYITPSWDENPLSSINGKASIVSAETFHKKYPKGTIPRKSKEFGKLFICRRGINTKTTTYTEEFQWEKVYNGTVEDIQALIDLVENGTKASRKGRDVAKAEDNFTLEDDEDDYDAAVQKTPKKRKTSVTSTPRKNRTPSKLLTPSHKRYEAIHPSI